MRIILAWLIFLPGLTYGQLDTTFWKPASSFPESSFLFITANQQSDILYLGTLDGLYTSQDNGLHWGKIKDINEPVKHIFIYQNSIYAASYQGKIHYSHDNGYTWSSSVIDSSTEITDIIALEDLVFVSTGHLEVINGAGKFRGKGLYKSNNKGISWEQVDFSVIHNARYISHLTIDSEERIYIGVNEYNSNDGVVLYSTDRGNTWHELPDFTFFDGLGLGTTKINMIQSLEVDHNDNLYVSLQGAAGTAATSLNLYNSFLNAIGGEEWHHMHLVPFGYDWMYAEAHNLFFAKNGDIFASRNISSFVLGSIFFSEDTGQTFSRKPLDPVILDGELFFNPCIFTQQKDGKVYVIQQFDNKIFYTNSSSNPVTGIEYPMNLNINIYPNPVSGYLTVNNGESLPGIIRLLDQNGREQLRKSVENSQTLQIDVSSLADGLYFLQYEIGGKSTFKRLLIQK